MRRFGLWIFATAFIASANADPTYVFDVSDIQTFEGQDNLGHENVNIKHYSPDITDGGGQFIIGTGDAQTNCASDHGVILKDKNGSGNCYYRQFSGPVHLSWYGVPDAGSSTCYMAGYSGCDATPAVTNALAAAATYGDGSVTTDGRSIALLTQCADCAGTTDTIRILPNQSLTCVGPPGATRGQTDDTPEPPAQPYYQLPHSIVLGKTTDHRQLTIRRKGQTDFYGCIIRPSWYFPHDTSVGGFNIPALNVRDTVNIVRQFTGTATACSSKACNMDNMFIIGFDVCDDTSGANKAIIKDVVEGCLVNEWLHDNGAGTKLQNFFGGPWIESGFGDAQFALWNVTDVELTGTDDVQVTIDTAGTGSPLPDDTVLISGLGQGSSVAPVSANGRWLVASSAQIGTSNSYHVVLKGASWVGPTYSGSIWKAGSRVIGVYDTTNIIPGQYVCAAPLSGTPPIPPFCTPPSGFSFSPAISSNISTLGSTGTGTVTISGGGTTAGWPVSGLVQVGAENMRYTVVSATSFNVTERDANGTSHDIHFDTDTITPAAPVVVGVIPTPVTPLLIGTALQDAVIVSAPASGTASGSVVFANDTRVVAGNLGNFALNPSYHTWTANAAAGSNPSGTLTIYASATGKAITPAANCFKIQPNMSVYDITASASLPGVTHVDCTTNQVTVGGAVSFSNHQIRFSGCGYPGFPDVDLGYSPQPWLGNCAATSVLLGKAGDTDTGDGPDQDQGTACEYVHVTASEIGLHTLDAPANNCVNLLLVDNGPTGPQADPGSVALWLDGHATKSQFSNGRIAFFNSILDTPSGAGQPDGVGVSNIQIGGNIILGADANAALSTLHGQLNPPATAFLFAPGSIGDAHVDSSHLPQWSVYVDDPAALAKLYCAANLFANAPCSQVKGTPTCVSNCGSVTGSDGNFDVTVSGLGGSPSTIQLAGAYAAAPICSVSASTTLAGAVASASISSVAWQPWGTTLSFKVSGPPAHVYGSCRGATG